MCSVMPPKNIDVREIYSFLENDQGLSAKLLGCVSSCLECLGASMGYFEDTTRRAFLRSKSNTGAGGIQLKKACQKLV